MSLKLVLEKETTDSIVISFDVWVKPGSKTEKIFVNELGVLIIQTRVRPIEGEANNSVVENVSSFIEVSKSAVEIVRGEKSRNKRVFVLIEFSLKKNKAFFESRFPELLKQK